MLLTVLSFMLWTVKGWNTGNIVKKKEEKQVSHQTIVGILLYMHTILSNCIKQLVNTLSDCNWGEREEREVTAVHRDELCCHSHAVIIWWPQKTWKWGQGFHRIVRRQPAIYQDCSLKRKKYVDDFQFEKELSLTYINRSNIKNIISYFFFFGF